jgi:hypothetical protein
VQARIEALEPLIEKLEARAKKLEKEAEVRVKASKKSASPGMVAPTPECESTCEEGKKGASPGMVTPKPASTCDQPCESKKECEEKPAPRQN